MCFLSSVIPSYVTTENSGNEDDNQLVIIWSVVSAIGVVILLILCIITMIWFTRRKTKKHHEHSHKDEIYWTKEIQPCKVDHECKISFLGNENKSNSSTATKARS